MEVVDLGKRFYVWDRGANGDRGGDCDGGRGWSRRVHDHAELAMVGLAAERMHVGHLDNSQQREQQETHHGGRRQSELL
jgi:hypothetical protein